MPAAAAVAAEARAQLVEGSTRRATGGIERLARLVRRAFQGSARFIGCVVDASAGALHGAGGILLAATRGDGREEDEPCCDEALGHDSTFLGTCAALVQPT